MSITSKSFNEDGTVNVRVTPGNGITLDQETGTFHVTDLRDAEDIIDDIETAYIPASIQDEDIRKALFEAYRLGYLAGNAESTPF